MKSDRPEVQGFKHIEHYNAHQIQNILYTNNDRILVMGVIVSITTTTTCVYLCGAIG